MPFVASFSASQSPGEPSEIDFIDTSAGSDVNITQRRVYRRLSDGTFLVEDGVTTDYDVWSIASLTKTLSGLLEDKAITITVEWLDVSDAVLYSSVVNQGFALYNETFDYQLTQRLSGNPLLINDNRFFPLKCKLRTAIDSGNDCIVLAGDIFNAQQCYKIATDLRIEAQYYFNANS